MISGQNFQQHIFYEAADLNNYETYQGICNQIDNCEKEWNDKALCYPLSRSSAEPYFR